jgi:hypothetical protein
MGRQWNGKLNVRESDRSYQPAELEEAEAPAADGVVDSRGGGGGAWVNRSFFLLRTGGSFLYFPEKINTIVRST